MTGAVEVTRNGVVESVHRVHVAVADRTGRLVARLGEPERVSWYRSAAKPFQALPLVEDGVVESLELTRAELALCCGSHGGERPHLEGVRSILEKVGLTEEALECGSQRPLYQEAADELVGSGGEPRSLHNNCSGKHAGMLALAVHHGWRPDGYVLPDHPVQRRMLAEISRWSGLAENDIGTGVDGCGVLCFAVPLSRMAGSFARLSAAAEAGEPAREVVEAMAEHPFCVAGTGRLCTELMGRAGDRVVVKTGAEGVYCAGLRGRGIGVALKVEDGGRRASGPALLRVLSALRVLEAEEMDALEAHARPPVLNTLGARVGEIRADFDLEELR